MGAWGTSIYSNDTACDVRNTYMDYLREQLSNQEAYAKTIKAFSECLECKEEAPLLWFSLADTQWKVGRLTPDVKATALDLISKEDSLLRWEGNKKSAANWDKNLEKLRVKLESEQRKEKCIRKRVIPNQNPWGMNDIYAYRLHSDHVRLGEEDVCKLYGKHLLLQKIGETKSSYSPDTVMRVQVYDMLFDTVPSADTVVKAIHEYRLLPFSSRISQERRYNYRLQGKRDPSYICEPLCLYDPIIMSVKMEEQFGYPEYPKDEITFICSCEGILNKQHERTDASEAINPKSNKIERYDRQHSYYWGEFHMRIAKLYLSWQNAEYDIIGDGTFEYPTREQQLRIKSELQKE